MDLSWTQWTPEQMLQAARGALDIKREGLRILKAIKARERTFLNTIAALERAGDVVTDVQQALVVLLNVHPNPNIRQEAQKTSEYLERENIALDYDRDLWRAIQEWSEKAEQLDPADRKLADDTIRDMRRMGFHLPDDQFERLKGLNEELQRTENEFEKAINEYEDHILVTTEQLAGLPERYVQGLERDNDGRYRVSLQYPELYPFMQYAHDDAARRELSHKQLRRGGWDNMERLAAMIRLRQEHAALLGYPTHADYVTEIRMARSGKAVEHFLTDIIEKLAPTARQELEALVDIKKRTTGGALEPVHYHEMSYWSNLLRKERYDLDNEMVREYLPTDHVMAGIMDIYQELLGLKFQILSDTLWHEDARLYVVHDASGGIVGHFTLDLYPRKGKYGHAAALPIRLGRQENGLQVTGMVALVCNFPRPTATTPSLLSHDETETLFHEFGHVMHALVSGGRYQRQNGFAVAMDFVEALSQIFEYWAWHPAVLERISKHYKTGQPLPPELIDKMLKAKRHMESTHYLSQTVQSLYDLHMHARPTQAPVDPLELAQMYRDMHLEYQHVPLPDDSLFAAGWSHMADYDAGYYGYLWSKVYAADMFTRFVSDPLDATVGYDYRSKVLAPGASKQEQDLVSDFLGRPPSSAAFLAELGIS